MASRIGIVGLPNVGKSHPLQRALRRRRREAANYPFCTIEPNVGVVPVPDARLDALGRLFKPRRRSPPRSSSSTSPAWSRGASKGEGLGNQFLANIREVDAIAHVLRCFEDPNVVHVAGTVDPARDSRRDRDRAHAEGPRVGREAARAGAQERRRRPAKPSELAKPRCCVARSAQGRARRRARRCARQRALRRATRAVVARALPPHRQAGLYVANVDEAQLATSTAIRASQAVAALADEEGAPVVVICAARSRRRSPSCRRRSAPSSSRALGPQRARPEPARPRRLRAARAHHLLHRRRGRVPRLDRPRGATAPQAAGVIHTDFEQRLHQGRGDPRRGPVKLGSEAAVPRRRASSAIEGKEYVVQDGDVMHFRFNV